MVFAACCHAAADVAFRLVLRQKLPDLCVQRRIAVRKPLDQVLMYRGLADAELLGGGADRRPVFNHVHSQLAGAFFNTSPHVTNPLSCVSLCKYMRRRRGNMHACGARREML